MIWLFNRKEVLLTRSAEVWSNACGALVSGGVPYITRTRTGGLIDSNRYRGVAFVRQDAACEYRIYVHRKDLDRAVYLLQTHRS